MVDISLSVVFSKSSNNKSDFSNTKELSLSTIILSECSASDIISVVISLESIVIILGCNANALPITLTDKNNKKTKEPKNLFNLFIKTHPN